MGKEIERKFLTCNDSFMAMATDRRHIRQAYLSTNPDTTVRVRIVDNRAWITVKSRTRGMSRGEWEYQIPAADASEMIEQCRCPELEKVRYIVPIDGLKWEVDVFFGLLGGLQIAEVELPTEDTQIELPEFVGKEVTGDPAYYNSNLVEGKLPPTEDDNEPSVSAE